MEFVMLFSTIGSSPVRNPLLFLFSILPIRFKDRFILKKKKKKSKIKEHRTSAVKRSFSVWLGSTNRAKNVYIDIHVGWKINLHARRKLKSSLTDRYLWQWNKVYPWRKRKSSKSFLSGKHIYMEESRWKRSRDSLAFLFSSNTVDLRLADCQIFSTGYNSGISFYSLINVKIIIR